MSGLVHLVSMRFTELVDLETMTKPRVTFCLQRSGCSNKNPRSPWSLDKAFLLQRSQQRKVDERDAKKPSAPYQDVYSSGYQQHCTNWLKLHISNLYFSGAQRKALTSLSDLELVPHVLTKCHLRKKKMIPAKGLSLSDF